MQINTRFHLVARRTQRTCLCQKCTTEQQLFLLGSRVLRGFVAERNCVRKLSHVHARIHAHTQAHTRKHIHTHAHTHKLAHSHPSLHTFPHTHSPIHTHPHRSSANGASFWMGNLKSRYSSSTECTAACWQGVSLWASSAATATSQGVSE